MRRREIGKLFILVLISITFLTSTSVGANGGKPILSEEEGVQLSALLGDLNEDAPEQVRNDVGTLLHQADSLMKEREAQANYEMPEEETEIWRNITKLLDEETIRQFGEDNYQEDKPDPNLDYGKQTMSNLKKTLSGRDWNKLNSLREEYFKSVENEDEEYDVDINKEIKSIIGKYKRLDADAVALNLLDDKNQKNIGMFTITSDFRAVYQDGSKNGLNSLSWKERKKLQESWEAVTDIIPKDLFVHFKYFKVGGDGELGTYAYVIPVDDQGKVWCMTVDPADIKDDGLFPYTVVHEMCHYLTLNEKQVDYYSDNVTAYPADRYSDWECVAKENSYLQSFYEKFWKSMINDWATNPDNPYFYDRHKSEFVTGYASTECAEDLAESFCAYVFLKSAATPAMQAKFDFFDGYPELKKLKKEILVKVKENNIYVNPEIEPEDGEIFGDAA
ncbi:hypothetical protein [Aminipila luticellarii]|uniref:Uncharacterized protein n=1 Tax=Aminipila luticellarii TaxID=2507160 RepID=A0A410PSM7_9FIRM|nr:hypothetical protein [Aminipila luticellarii]QAT41924.1 hypothetical protein EQM06_01050 [Aminipila luticellarii]